MPITLADSLALERNRLRQGIIRTFVEESAYMTRLPIETTGQLNVVVTYLSDIPRVPLRFLNEAPTDTSTAKWSQIAHTLVIFDKDIDIDPVLLANKNLVQRLDVAQTQVTIKVMAYTFCDYAINGDPTVDARQPLGLRRMLDKDPRFAGMSINATDTAVELDCRVGSASDGNYLKMLHKLDNLIALLDNKPTCFLTNAQAILTIWAALRQLKLLDVTRDQFDREIMAYRGVPFLDMGWKPSGALEGRFADPGTQGDQIIGNDSEATSTDNGANAYSNQTPIYAVRFGPEHFMGLQQEPMQTKVYGETESPPHYFRTNIRWVVSPGVAFQKRSCARLVGCAFSVAPA